MNDEEQVVFHGPHQPLAEAAQRDDDFAVGVIDWRIERPDEKRAGYTDPIESLAHDARLQRMQVELDIGELRQALLSVEN